MPRIALPREIAIEAFADRDPARRVARFGGETMGTNWSVMFADPGHLDLAGTHGRIVERLDRYVAELSHWQADSALSGYNRAPAGSSIALPADFATVIAAAIDIAARSDGGFDPTIGRVVAMGGFGPDPAERTDDETAIAQALAQAGWRKLRVMDGRLHQPGGLSLDFSGIAKGHAVDLVADLLAVSGIAHALVEIGGELVGRGVRPDGDPWWVELEDPPGVDLPPLRIALHGLAVATSGDYRRGGHTIDPRSGRPLANGIRSVSVIDRSAMRADAWATAITVLGAEAGLALAERESLAVRIVGAREWMSPALVEMLEY